MTRRERRAANRARKGAQQIAENYQCPDCQSENELEELAPCVFQLNVRHDETCPWYRAHRAEIEGNE